MARLGRDIATYGIVDLFARSLGLITSPFVTRLLTQEQYGAGPLLSSVWAPVALLQYGGMDSSYPYFKAKDRDGLLHHQLITTATFISNFFCVVIWALFFAASMSGTWLGDYANVSKTELLLFLISLLPAGLIYWILYLLRFSQKPLAFVRITLLGRILPFLATIPIMLMVAQPDRLVTMWGVGALIQILALAYALYEVRRVGLWPYSRQHFSGATARKMLRYGLFLAPVAMLYALSTVTDRLMVGWFMGPDDVAILQLAMAVGSVSAMLAGWFGLAFDPHLVEWIATGDPLSYEGKMQTIVHIIAGLFLGMACGAAIWSEWFFYLVYPANYMGSALLIPFMVLASVFPVLSRVAVATIIIADKPKYQMALYAAAFVINVCVCLYAIPRHGLIGAVMSTMVSEAVIFSAWVFLGKAYFRNLNLGWVLPYAMIIAALLFISLYDPGQIGAVDSLVQALAATLILAGVFFLYLRLVLGKEVFIRLYKAPLSLIKSIRS